MSSLSAAISEQHTQRYEALLRATNAIGTSTDCDAAAETIVGALREVIAFDYLELVVFESDSWTVTWHLLHSNGITRRLGLSEVVVNGTPIELVHASQQALVVADWNEESRFQKHGQFLSKLGIAATCVLPLARGQRRLGVISVGTSRANAYSEDEVRFLSVVADQIALAIDAAVNFYLSRQPQDRLKLNPWPDQPGRVESEFSGTAANNFCKCSRGHALRRCSHHAARAGRSAFAGARSGLPGDQGNL